MHDPLTGLPNRIVLAERLEWALGRTGNDCQSELLIDLDRFKDINDTFGHPTGDDILVNVSRRLLTAAPVDAVVARLGGDEFAILVETVPDQRRALVQAERIVKAIRRPFVIDEQQMYLSISIGLVTIEPGQGPMSPPTLCATPTLPSTRPKRPERIEWCPSIRACAVIGWTGCVSVPGCATPSTMATCSSITS